MVSRACEQAARSWLCLIVSCSAPEPVRVQLSARSRILCRLATKAPRGMEQEGALLRLAARWPARTEKLVEGLL